MEKRFCDIFKTANTVTLTETTLESNNKVLQIHEKEQPRVQF